MLRFRIWVGQGESVIQTMALVAAVWAAAVAATRSPGAEGTPAGGGVRGRVLINDVPYVVQKEDFCGEACAAMYLNKLGRPLSQDDVFRASGLDPALGRGCHTKELAEALKRLGFKTAAVWHRIEPDGRALRLNGRRVAASRAAGSRFTDADYARHVMKLRRRLPDRHFHIVIEKPFVVIGDEPADVVRRRARRTVRWAVRMLKRDFFNKDPRHILDIWLFKGKPSYERNVKRLFGRKPDTPYGYYSATHRALVMNIATGGGTLVHEIVHPFMEANFPECPAWFNEGLGTLYEQCRQKDGRIWGLTNWRLAGLQRAISQGKVPSFKQLLSTNDRDFYQRDPGTNYAQARYLCYYLQHRGVLRKFYRRFAANHASDPTGYETLREVLGEKDMKAFQRKWEAFVLKLRFARR